MFVMSQFKLVHQLLALLGQLIIGKSQRIQVFRLQIELWFEYLLHLAIFLDLFITCFSLYHTNLFEGLMSMVLLRNTLILVLKLAVKILDFILHSSDNHMMILHERLVSI